MHRPQPWPQAYAPLLLGSWRGALRKELSSVFVQISLLAFGPSCEVRVRVGVRVRVIVRLAIG